MTGDSSECSTCTRSGQESHISAGLFIRGEIDDDWIMIGERCSLVLKTENV